MAKPPVVNIAARPAEASPQAQSDAPRKPGLDFSAELPPTNPEAAAELAAGANYGVSPAAPTAAAHVEQPKPLPAVVLEKPRFSLTTSDMDMLTDMERDYRRRTGDEVSSSRLVRAAMRAFFELDPEDRARRIAGVEEYRSGPKKRR